MYKSLDEFRGNYPFTYVDVGARWGAKSNLLRLFPNSKWIGFEPDPDEFAEINLNKQKAWVCFPFALSDKSGAQDLYITKAPDWRSLYEPDPEMFNRFNGLKDFYQVMRHCQVPLRSLDELAASYQDLLRNADYLKLDVQGAEGDVLRGAQSLLSTSLIAVEVEVEFLQLYKGQPLFGQIHNLLLDKGFVLFDLSRNRCIHSGFTSKTDTRGQLVWSDAVYLKDFRSLLVQKRYDKLLVLILVAMELGFLDYCASVLEGLRTNKIVDEKIQRELFQYLSEVSACQRRKMCVFNALARLPFGRRFLRYLRKVIDNNYAHIVSSAHPEYYFRRD